ncbi:MAG TPA: DUF922 domain-containing protein [Vicinamibacterales bacterium]|nr:DUF922 domain-containing protein [Vicinamibacterales bacterium]
MPRIFIVVAALIVSGCLASLPTSAPAGPSLTESINARVKELDAFAWTPRRPLTWKDFRGQPPRESPAAAETAYSLLHGVRCVGSAFEFRVLAAFRPEQSWVRPDILQRPADSARALRHEQTHFDLTEVHARRLRRYFTELVAPCRGSNGDLSDAATRYVRDEANAQAQYDKETDNGRRAAEQARWDKEVDGQLFSTSKFTLPGNGKTPGV